MALLVKYIAEKWYDSNLDSEGRSFLPPIEAGPCVVLQKHMKVMVILPYSLFCR